MEPTLYVTLRVSEVKRKMSNQTNVSVEITYSAYEHILKYVLDEIEDFNVYSHEAKRKDEQFVRIYYDGNYVFLQRYPVIYRSGEKETFHMSVNILPLKSGESNTFFKVQSEVINAKTYLESFIREVGLLKTYPLNDLQIGTSNSEESEKPY